jgi:hypothetical protein
MAAPLNVTLNSFRVQISTREAARRWMLKQVQHDGWASIE